MSDETVMRERRLPVYLVIDCSGSMAGEPIAAMQMGLQSLVSDLTSDPYALETVWLSVLTFSSTAEQIVPLTDINEFTLPELEASGTTALGEAVELLETRLQAEVRRTAAHQKGDWRPMVFLFTDGEPTDEWRDAVQRFRASSSATVIACGDGPAINDATLKQLSETVVRLENTQPGTLGAFLKWVTASVTAASKSLGARASGTPELPTFAAPSEPQPAADTDEVA